MIRLQVVRPKYRSASRPGPQGGPQERRMDLEEPEDQAAERSLQDGDDDVTLDRRPDDDREFGEKRALLIGTQGNCIPEAP
jgi:hypothetical protein